MLVMAITLIVFWARNQRKMYQKERAVQRMQLDHQQALLNNNILVQEQERSRIARDLHDEIGNRLNITRLNIAQLRPDNPDHWPELISDAKTLIDAAIDASRRISHDLLPPVLQEFGLSKAVAELCRELSQSGTLKAEFEANDDASKRFDRTTELGMFRIVQELMTNSIKHARAAKITVTLDRQNNHLELQYADDGKGMDLKKLSESNGLGLQNLESRATMINGILQLKSSPGNGFHATLTVKDDQHESN